MRIPLHLPRISRRSYLILVVPICLLVGFVTIVTIRHFKRSPTPSSVTKNSPQPIGKKADYTNASIVPTGTLPSGYSVSPDSPYSPETAGSVIITELVADGKPPVFITQQNKPHDLQFEIFYDTIGKRKEIKTDLGLVYYGTAEDSTSWVATVLNGNDWILVTADARLSEAELIQIVQSLHKRG